MSAVLEESKRFFGEDDLGEEATPPTAFARDIIEWMEFSETGLTYEELGKPTLWRVKIFPKQPRMMSRGGIALPISAQDVERHGNYIGQVVAMGPMAGKSEKFENPEWREAAPPNLRQMYEGLLNGKEFDELTIKDSAAPRYLWNIKVGDWVIYGRFAGQKTVYKGVEFATVNDDEITEKIDNPGDYKVYI